MRSSIVSHNSPGGHQIRPAVWSRGEGPECGAASPWCFLTLSGGEAAGRRFGSNSFNQSSTPSSTIISSRTSLTALGLASHCDVSVDVGIATARLHQRSRRFLQKGNHHVLQKTRDCHCRRHIPLCIKYPSAFVPWNAHVKESKRSRGRSVFHKRLRSISAVIFLHVAYIASHGDRRCASRLCK